MKKERCMIFSRVLFEKRVKSDSFPFIQLPRQNA